MRYSAEHKQETRMRIVAAAGQIFREEGYGGAGIDALTKAAGVTNGAFYGHFKSKSVAFRTAILAGLDDLRQGISALKTEHPEGWLKTFVKYYLGYKRTCKLGEACALPVLSPDVMRADDQTREVYTAELHRLMKEVASGLAAQRPDQSETAHEDRAIVLLSMLSGAAVLSRAVSDPDFADRIAQVIETEALKC